MVRRCLESYTKNELHIDSLMKAFVSKVFYAMLYIRECKLPGDQQRCFTAMFSLIK
jgi:hypothetical protein